MSSSITGKIITLIVLLFVSGFFSAAETALMSLSKIRVRYMLDENMKGAKLVQKLTDTPSKLIGTVLVGNNIANISASAIATSLAIDLFEGNAVMIATVVMTILILVFSEITPKSLAAQNAEKVSVKLAKPLMLVVILINPIVIIITKVTNFLVKLLGGTVDQDAPFITEDELKSIVNVGHEEGVLETEEKQMIYNVFEFGDLQIKDAMIQRTDIVAISADYSFDEVMENIKKEKYSRYPIYKESFDDIVGILNVKDIIYSDDNEEDFNITKYIREPYFTYEYKMIPELFKEMRAKRIHMAIVLDEYGGTAGIITIEDLIEEIVGEIQDEYDELEEEEIKMINDRQYAVDGSVKIAFIDGFFDLNIESDDFDSLGGFIIGQLGRLPKAGEIVVHENIKFTVENVSKHRIKKIKIDILSEC